MRHFNGSVSFGHAVISFWALLATVPVLAEGRTPGSFAVSSTGEAQYSIPIFAPPGVNGLTPELALMYGHRHEGTLAGVGWGISGLSSIYRCEKTWAQKAEASAPQNAFADRYCLDGVQLRHFSGTYGRTGSTYRTEVESYSRITVLSEAGNGPGSFKVELKNGLIYEYGTTADSQILSIGKPEARAWALSKIKDRSGNEITVVWQDDTANGSYRIDHVDYATNSIAFEWESKPATEVSAGYVNGSAVQEIHRLQAIEVQQGGSAIRRYELTYEGALSITSKSRLASIEECAGSLCRPPTTFAYQNGSVGLQSEVNTAQTAPVVVSSSFPLDVNGDGREDLVYASGAPGSGTWKVMFANASGGYGTPIDSGQSNQNYAGAIPIDYNQDGLGDVLVPYNGTHWYVMLGSASGLGALTNTLAPATPSGRGENARALDIDGDGRQDLVWADLYGFVVMGAGTSPIGTPRRVWNELIGDWDETRTIQALCAGGGCSFSRNVGAGGASAPTFGDFNGDGLTDLFFYSGPTQPWPANDSQWWYALSRGTDFTDKVSVGNANAFSIEHVILDWDADGRDDVLAQYASGGWALKRANGVGFDGWVPLTGSFPSFPPMMVADIDGDGLHDFVYVQSNTWRYRKHAGVRPDLLTNVTDGYGNTVSVTHGLLTSSSVHTKTTGATFPEQEWQAR